MMSTTISIRKATIDDVSDLVRLRRMMFEAIGYTDPAALDASDQAGAIYMRQALDAGDFHAWLAVTASDWPVACGGLLIDRHLPTPNNLSGKVAYILNVVTHPDHRRRGLARKLMQTMLRWVNEQGITKVSLHASEDGASLYKMLGFKPANEMQLDLAHESRR